MAGNIKIYLGEDALKHCAKYAGRAECRDVFASLLELMAVDGPGRPVPFLSGLSGTGRQAMLYAVMCSVEDPSSIAYIVINGSAKTCELVEYLDICWHSQFGDQQDEKTFDMASFPEAESLVDLCMGAERRIIRYVFIDHAERLDDFTRNSKIIGDIFNNFLKIVISADPMSVIMACADPFLGNGWQLNMNHISFREWCCISEDLSYAGFIRQAGINGSINSAKYLHEMLAAINLAVNKNKRFGFGIWYDLNALAKKDIFQQVGLALVELAVMRSLHDIVRRHFIKQAVFLEFDRFILERIIVTENSLFERSVKNGTAQVFFEMLESLGIGRQQRSYDLRNYKSDSSPHSEAEMYIRLLKAMCSHFDDEKKRQRINMLQMPDWFFLQPALALDLKLAMFDRLWKECGGQSGSEPYKRMCVKIRAHIMLEAMQNDAYAACPKHSFGDSGDYWDLSSILTKWGHIDLVATCSGNWHSEVFIFAETAAADPEKMLLNPRLRELLTRKLSGPCAYYILHTGASKTGPDGIKWLNLAEFLESLPSRWPKQERGTEK